jgi:uncharacterized protein YxjI
MIEVKILCECGAKYKFDVEPVNGRMPTLIQCPSCGADGTRAANQIIAQNLSAAPAAAAIAAPAPSGLRLAGSAGSAAESAFGFSAASVHHAGDARPLLERTTFFVKERAGLLKLTDVYDILDPVTGQAIGIAKEEPPGWAKWLRLAIKKQMMPTAVNVYESEGQPPVLSIRRGFTLFRSKVRVVAGDGQSLGYFQSKLLTIGGGFNVFDNAGQQVAQVKGNWKGWDFKFLTKGGREIGTVTKKWAGLGKELFTSADNYIISLSDVGGASSAGSALLLAAGLAIDVVFKEAA